MQEAQIYSHDGPIRCRKHRYILTADQSDAEHEGIFSDALKTEAIGKREPRWGWSTGREARATGQLGGPASELASRVGPT
eukprot:3476831-Pyramimonas_sp.AAC.1